MSRIYLCENFNNLSNKMCIVYDRIELYPQPVFEATVNFRPGDGVSTSLVLMYKDNVLAPPVNLEPDYAIVCADSGGGIESRWFVTESVRLSDSKFSLQLQRDVAADYKSNIMESVAFVKRGWVDKSNPLIFNSENGSYNQLLRERIDLKDRSGLGGYIAFLAPNFISNYSSDPSKLEIQLISDKISAELLFGNPTDGEKGQYKYCWGMSEGSTQKSLVMRTNAPFGLPNQSESISTLSFTVGPWAGPGIQKYNYDAYQITFYSDGSDPLVEPVPFGPTERNFPTFKYGASWSAIVKPPISMVTDLAKSIVNEFTNYIWNQTNIDEFVYSQVSATGAAGSSEDIAFLATQVDKIALTEVTKYYQLLYNQTNTPNNTTLKLTGDFKEQFESFIQTVTSGRFVPYTEAPAAKQEGTTLDLAYYNINFEWRRISSSTLKLPLTAKYVNDCPYYIMCIPDMGLQLHSDGKTWTQKVNAFQIYTQLQLYYNEFVYDVQYVPYLPLVQDNYNNGVVMLPDKTQVGLATTTEGAIEAGVYFAGTDRFWFDLILDTTSLNNFSTLSAINTKVQCETVFGRLCSMDGSTSLDINLAKNNGLSQVRINCRYAPYQSYISVQPYWSSFYGANIGLKDTRGLNIVTSNTVTRVNDAWRNYILQNQNYQAIFDRQLQSMDTQFDIQAGAAARDILFNLGNTIFGAATSGSMASAALTTAGGAASLTQQALAYEDMANSFKDKRSLNVDMFNLQNGNIKARANTLSKVNAMSPIYNTWPYIEIYEATAVERAALSTYITEFSMNIGALTSQLSAYVTPNPNARKYIQADIVRLNGKFDAHMADTIKSVISNGIYFVEVTTNE